MRTTSTAGYDAGHDAGHDVIVVGARVAGAATAMLLARAGARVLLLERGRPGTDTVSTHALMRAGVLQLSRWGLLDRVVAAGTPPVREVTFRTVDEEPLHVTLRPTPGVDALYAPRRRVLDGILVDAAARAGVDVRHRVQVAGLLHGAAGRVEGVVTGDGRRHHARYVVGADGLRSTVAAAVHAPVQQAGREASAVRYTYVSGLDDHGYEWCYGNGAGAGVIPTNDGRHCVFAATTPERLRLLRAGRSVDAVFATLLRLAAPDQAERILAAERADRFRGWAGQVGFLRRPWGPGWALVGDAGYFKDPITSHGMTDALRDAELLARALIVALEGGPEREALEAYRTQRDALAAPMLAAAEEMASYAWTNRSVGPVVRRMSAAMTDEVDLLESMPPVGRDRAVAAVG